MVMRGEETTICVERICGGGVSSPKNALVMQPNFFHQNMSQSKHHCVAEEFSKRVNSMKRCRWRFIFRNVSFVRVSPFENYSSSLALPPDLRSSLKPRLTILVRTSNPT